MTPRPLRAALLAALALAACESDAEYAEALPEADVAEVEQAGALGAPAFDAPDAPTQLASQAAPAASRLLVRTAEVRLRADDHAEAVARARALAAEAGGFVGEESGQRYADRVETTLTLRVPADRFDAALAAVAALDGEVEARSVAVDDVTRRVADVEARLEAKRAAEAQYLALVGRAGSIEDVLAVQARLDGVREEIEAAEAGLRVLRDGVALGTIRLTVFEASAAGVTAGPGWFARAGRAVGAGWDGVLEVALGVLALWPLVLVGAGVALTVRQRVRARSAAA